jgi:hypothetical protein
MGRRAMRWSMSGLSMVVTALLLPQCSLFQLRQAAPAVQEQGQTAPRSADTRSNELDPGIFEFVGTTSTYLDGATVLTAVDSDQGDWIVGGPTGALQRVGGSGEPTTEAALFLSGYPIRAIQTRNNRVFIAGGTGLVQVLSEDLRPMSEPQQVMDGEIVAMSCNFDCLVVAWNPEQRTSEVRLLDPATLDPKSAARVVLDGHKIMAVVPDPSGSSTGFVAVGSDGVFLRLDKNARPVGSALRILGGLDVLSIEWNSGWIVGGRNGQVEVRSYIGELQKSYHVSGLGDVLRICGGTTGSNHIALAGTNGRVVLALVKYARRTGAPELSVQSGMGITVLGGKEIHVVRPDRSGSRERWLFSGEDGLGQVVELPGL